MANKKISELPETSRVQSEDYLMVVQDGSNKKVKVSAIRGATNLTEQYLELTAEDGTSYRAMVNQDGELIVMPSEFDTAEAPNDNDNQLYWGLIINQMYGGGSQVGAETSVSHSFVELYNTTAFPINLKGLYLFYRAKAGSWQKLALRGVVPPYHSFLIRGKEHTDYHMDCVRCHVDSYDQLWDIAFSNQGFSMYLCVGDGDVADNPIKYTYDALGNITQTHPRYIDLLGAGGKQKDQTIQAYEGRYWHCMDEHTAVHRIDFHYGSNNQTDVEPIDYKACDVSIYRPRSIKDGEWDLYFNKLKLNPRIPNVLNMCYAETGDSGRTFTWQSAVTDEGYLRYRLAGETTWKEVETTRELVRHKDQDCTIHRAIIKNLTPGTYEYQAGEEGAWSDLQTFVIKQYSSSDHIKFLWTTDQQGWTEYEYKAWKTAIRNILDWETFDFHLNTGDISQNANRSFEWRYYYKYTSWSTRQMCHMLCCGNNDLIDKKYSNAFAYYSTFENSPWYSVHAWDLGYVHFVCLNSNEDYTFEGITPAQFIQKQCEWLDQHLTEVNQRSTKPRWVICYMHISPFTIVRTKRVQPFIPIFEKHKVPLVLCGHNHTYSRSKAIYSGYDGSAAYNDYVKVFDADESSINKSEDLRNGTHYVMCQSTGYKLSGKEKAITLPDNLGGGRPWWYQHQENPSQPSYCMVDISYDSINIKSYMVQNTMTTDELKNITVNDYGDQTRYEFDSLIINHSDRA